MVKEGRSRRPQLVSWLSALVIICAIYSWCLVGTRQPDLAVQDHVGELAQDESTVDGWTLEDMIDAEMLALLPFSLDGDLMTDNSG